MGERSAGEPVDVAAPPVLPRPALLALVAALILLVTAAVAPRPRLDDDSADALLLARSLASDGDRVWGAADAARAAQLAAMSGEALAAADDAGAPTPSADRETGAAFRAPIVYGLLLAPWAAIAGARGALLAQSLLLALAVLVAARNLARRLGGEAAWVPLVLLLGSVLLTSALRLWSEVTLAALALLAFALATGGRAAPRLDVLPDLYPEEKAERRLTFGWRWLGAGALLGAVVSAGWWMSPLLLPAAFAVPRSRRRGGVTALLGGALLVVLLLAAAGAATAHASPVPSALLRGVGWSAPALSVFDLRLLGWDVAYALAGRHLGVVFYLGPLLLLAAVGAGRRRARGDAALEEEVAWAAELRRWLWGGVALALLLLLLARPFDLAGSGLTLGPRSFLPLYAALWFAAARAPGRGAVILALLWSAAWMWPQWRSPHEAIGPRGELRYAAPYLAPWSPLETSQQALRFGSRMPFGSGKAVLLGGEALGAGRVAAVPAGAWVELLAGVPGELSGFWVEAGEQAGNELPVRGGTVSDLIFRPDGGVAFVVHPSRAWARHRMPGSARPWSFYHVSFRLPGPAGKRFTIRLRPG